METPKNNRVEDYLNSYPLELPIEHPIGFSMVGFDIECYTCHKDTEDIRGEYFIHDQCIEVKAGGLCKQCRLVTFARLRQYRRRSMLWTDHGILQVQHKTPPLTKLWNFIKRLLYGGKRHDN